MRKFVTGLFTATALMVGVPAHAALNSFLAVLYGFNEVPGPGDPDGFGLATLVIDTSNNTASWSILANNIVFPLTGAHIHSGAAGTSGPVIVDFGAQLTGTVTDVDLASITPANASLFYVNLHNAVYPSGAIRGQLSFTGSVVPEPGTYALMLAGMGAIGLMARRRRVQA